jgi:hypothetical protein
LWLWGSSANHCASTTPVERMNVFEYIQRHHLVVISSRSAWTWMSEKKHKGFFIGRHEKNIRGNTVDIYQIKHRG